MDIFAEIKDRLRTKKFEKIQGKYDGGCINKGHGFQTDSGPVFVKQNSDAIASIMFHGEMISLKKIQKTNTVCVPKPFFVINDSFNNGSVLVMEFLKINPTTQWAQMGSDLADLHLFNSVLFKKKEKLSSWIGKPPLTEVDIDIKFEKEIKLKLTDEIVEKNEYEQNFGFSVPTSCGKILQNNEWHHDWIEFYARNRMEIQINMILEKYGDRILIENWSELQLKVDKFFPDIVEPIKPALLHGDLWCGNVGQVDDCPVIFDPASFYGHSEMDLSISKLFGGFDERFYEAYFKKIPQQKNFKKRQDLYMLFHLLNHWNHFGSSYKERSLRLMKKLNQN